MPFSVEFAMERGHFRPALVAGMAPKASAMGIDETPEMITKTREELRKEGEAREASYRTAQGGASASGAARGYPSGP